MLPDLYQNWYICPRIETQQKNDILQLPYVTPDALSFMCFELLILALYSYSKEVANSFLPLTDE